MEKETTNLKPRCFKGLKTLPTYYVAQNKALMTYEIYIKWLNAWDSSLCYQKWKILLLHDNCPAHNKVEELVNLTNIELVYQTKSQLSEQLLVTWSFENQLLVIRSIDQLDIRSYWLCGQFASDKTVDHITDPHCIIDRIPAFEKTGMQAMCSLRRQSFR